MDSASLAKVIRRVEDWKLKLIDLSKRNRLIHFRPTRSSNIAFQRPGIDTIFERLVVKDRAWEIWRLKEEKTIRGRLRRPRKTQIVPENIEPSQIDRILRNLVRRSVSEYRERGIRILYVTFGMLNWREVGTKQYIKSPIVLTPIELRRKTSRDPYKIQVPAVEDEAILNPALKLKLQYDYQLEIPQLLDFEEQTISEYLKQVEESFEGMDWMVEPVVQMGLFSFHKLVMYQDLTDNLEIIVEHPIIQALAGVKSAPISSKSLPLLEDLDLLEPRETYQVLDADSSQQLCIQYALNGQSFVMHGPPGTGKSQTIANMISEFIAEGKSVLFVSEKMAALEVVYNRLKAKNLDDYCLELHSHKANKKEVVAELSRSLNEHLETRGQLKEEEINRLQTRREQLNEYVRTLHQIQQPIGISSYQLLGRISRLEESPFIPSGYPKFTSLDQKKLLEIEDLFRRLANTWVVVEEGDDFPWKGCMEDNSTLGTRVEWIHLLDTTLNNINMLSKDSLNYSESLGLQQPKSIGDYDRLQRLSKIISSSPRPPPSWLESIDLKKIDAQAQKHMKEWERHRSSVKNLEKKYDSRVLVLSPGYANRVEQAWNEVKELLAPVSKGDGGLLSKSKSLESYLENLPQILEESRKRAEELTTLLGIKDEVTNLERIQHINELARFCREEPRPMRSWMDRKSLEETKEFLESLEIRYQKREKLKEKLTDYSDDLLALDLDSMIDFFEGPGNSILRIIRPSYYNIKSQISQARVDSIFPQDVLVDLRIAKELQTIESDLKMVEDKAHKILGIYFKDEEPDIKRAKEALRRAARSLWIVGRARAPKELRDNLCEGTSPRAELVEKSNSLQSTLSKLRYQSNQLRGLIPRKLPSTRKSIRKSPLKQVIDWAQIVNERFSKLSIVGGDVSAARLTDHPTTYNLLLEDLKTVEVIQNFEDEIERKQEEFFKIFGSLFNGIHTDWNNILNAIGWTQRLISTLQRGVPELLKKAVSENGSNLLDYPKIKDRWDEISLALDELEDRFETSYWPEPRHRYNLEKIRERINLLRSRIDDLQTWIDHSMLKKALSEEGLGKFLQRLIDQKIDRKKLVPVFQKSMYQGLIDLFFKENSNLEAFRGRDHEQFIYDFQRLDKKFIELTPQRVIEIANRNKPQGVFIQAPDSEITILMREASKKRRHMPLRQLFEKIPNLIRRLKPCLMMSPISVSQFLIPGGLHFDLVVFDEASQIYSEDAVGSIYRGDNLVVAGDPKQLPPTPFFQYTIDENFDWDANTYEFDVFDSVLDECMSIGLPVQMLRWHYRSKHDSLISFSNDRFYNGRLVLFPASKMGSDDLGLEFVHVKNGMYDRGGRRNNPREAEVVTELVFKHFENHPEKTLGVVTFSISQKNTVQDAIEDRLRENPKFEKFFIENRLDGFFVKNLENVQGDERDVMIFSVGYGFDMKGKITMNFGPLNKTGGERRLNVAITRAREKVILVSSIRYDNINLNATEAEGVHSLYHYLRYAERRPKNLIETAVGIRHISSLEADVSEEVGSLGYKVIPWVGSSSFRVDLGILDPKDPGRFILGIICDGDNYRSADTSRDRDRLRGQVLESLGWRIHRIWSPDWVQRRKTEIERLKNALKTAEKSRKEVNTKIIQKSKLAKNKIKRVKVIETTSEKLQEVRPYSFVRLKPNHLFSRYTSTHKERYLKQYHSEVRRLLPQLVRGEGPIHIDLAFKRMNNAFRLRRATKYFREAFNEEVKKADGNTIEIKKEFLWSKNKKDVEIRVPVEGVKESFRSIEHVSPEEISKAMFLAAKHSLGLKEETLINETASLLGFKRMGSNINETIKSIFDKEIKSGKLAQNGNLIIASQS